MQRWLQHSRKWLTERANDLSLICLHAILSPSLRLTYYLLGFWVNSPAKRSSRQLTLLNWLLVLVVKLETWWIRTRTNPFFRMLAYSQTQKQQEDGQPTMVGITLLSVWGALLRVKERISLLLTTHTQNKKQQ